MGCFFYVTEYTRYATRINSLRAFISIILNWSGQTGTREWQISCSRTDCVCSFARSVCGSVNSAIISSHRAWFMMLAYSIAPLDGNMILKWLPLMRNISLEYAINWLQQINFAIYLSSLMRLFIAKNINYYILFFCIYCTCIFLDWYIIM